jgi:hypothetical protein
MAGEFQFKWGSEEKQLRIENLPKERKPQIKEQHLKLVTLWVNGLDLVAAAKEIGMGEKYGRGVIFHLRKRFKMRNSPELLLFLFRNGYIK